MAFCRKHPDLQKGDRYGNWTILRGTSGPRSRMTTALCRCTCGQCKEVSYDNLIGGQSRMCRACSLKQWQAKGAQASLRYGFIPKPHRQRIRDRIGNAIRRCFYLTAHNYERYGGRGISIFPAWQKDRTLFARYLITLPGWDNPDLQMDRIDNDGNYEPGNLRFITPSKNCRNRRTT